MELSESRTVIFQQKKLFYEAAWLVFSIFMLNSLASYFYWYASIWWFDMPMHFLGGLWIGLLSLSVLGTSKFFPKLKKATFFKICLSTILLVLLIGLFWEIFEYSVQGFLGLVLANPLDSLSDVMFDLAGGLSACVYALMSKSIRYIEAS